MGYSIDRNSKEVSKAAWALNLAPEEWSFLRRVNWYYMYHSKQNSLVWCKVPKAGSSTWTYNFLKLAGVNPKEKIHKVLRDHYPKQDSNKVMQDTFRFMVVRHPFERILSAYRDKLEDLARDINTPVTKFDEHWMPIWMLCSPCIVKYEVIAKMETFSEDTQFTLAQAGLEDSLTVEWKHRTGTGGNSDAIADYFDIAIVESNTEAGP